VREALPIWKNLYGVTNESREEQPGQPTQQKPERAISVDVRLSILVTLPDGRFLDNPKPLGHSKSSEHCRGASLGRRNLPKTGLR
jgi:hypothetical protein